MESVHAIYRKGFFKPLSKVNVEENEEVILGVMKQGQMKITEDTFGAVDVQEHRVVEKIIEDTEYEEQ